VDDIHKEMAFEIGVSDDIGPAPVPTPEQLDLLRIRIDPGGVYVRRATA
jgi:hypothetical protein